MADTTRDDALIVFTPSGKRGRFPLGTPVLQAARALGVDIDSVCGGRAICGRCQVAPSIGDFAKHGITSRAEHLGPVTKVEVRYDEKRGLKAGRRLSCQTLIQGDCVIDVPAESQVHKQVVRKRAEVRDIKLDPVTKLYYIVVEEPDMHHPSSDLERVYDALKSQWAIEGVTCDLAIMQALQAALRQGDWRITVAVHHRMASRTPRIVALWPGFHDRAFGMAVDVGSTTIAMHLCRPVHRRDQGVFGLMNPQIRFGEDLMSRVSYVMMNPEGRRGNDSCRARSDQRPDRQGLQGRRDRPRRDSRRGLRRQPDHASSVAGHRPDRAWAAHPSRWPSPAPSTSSPRRSTSRSTPAPGSICCPASPAMSAPTRPQWSHRGPHRQNEMMLLVDVGTNAEIVLGNKARTARRLLAHRPGLRGRADLLRPARRPRRHRAHPHRSGNVRTALQGHRLDQWSDEPGFDEAAKKVGVTGICGSGIIEVIAEMYLAGIITEDGMSSTAISPPAARAMVQTGRTFSYL
jgi:uncharacterized 2Fe-2S/4Fe-4S cluster protein (DUF4445 family)